MPDPTAGRGSGTGRPSRRANWAAVALLLFVCVVSYANALTGRFISDDLYLVADNPALRRWNNLPGLFTTGFWSTAGQEAHEANYYRPLVAALYLVQYQLFGPSPLGYHAVNIALHAGVTLGVFGIARRLSGRAGRTSIAGPLAAGLLFAAHPIHTENVAWIGGVTDLLCVLFIVLAWFWDLRGSRPGRSIGTGFLLLCALLCKEVAIAFPAILAVQDHLDGRYPWRARLRRYAVLAGFVAGYLVLRTTALRGIAPVPKNDLDLSAGEGVMNAFVLLAKYLGLLVYPADLCAVHLIQPERSWLSGAVLASVGLTAALAAIGWWAIYRRRSAAVALAALVLPLLPVIYLPRLGPIFAERFLYFPSVGAALLTGLMVARSWDPPWRSQRFVLSAALAVLVIVLAGLTIDRNRDWKDEYSQSLDITAKVPSAYSQHLVVAYAQYFKLGRQEEGLRHYEAAFKVKPELRNSVPPSLNEFGVGLLRARDVPGAIRHFELAVRLSPAYALAWNNLGIAYYEQGRRDLAIEQFRKALAVDPNNREAKVNLAKLTASD